MNRLSSLDYLRGLAAFGIMVFHFSMWTFGLFTKAEDIPGRIGIYGVSVFYILSGITLYHVYYYKIGAPSKSGLFDFAVKRAFRIFPLLWLMTIITLLVEKEAWSSQAIILNFTGLFSVYQWSDTICYGAWSIGNELVFYLFFPVFIFISKRSRILLGAVSVALALLYLWFAFVKLAPLSTIDGVTWAIYTNPLNQVFLFLGGYLIGHLSKEVQLHRTAGLLLIVASIIVFAFYPVKGDAVLLMTGLHRVVFTIVCLTLCFAFYKTGFGLTGIAHKCFSVLGEISYSVYLVHPVVWHILTKILGKYFLVFPPALRLLIAFSLTLAVAYLIYRLFEKYFMKLGGRVSKRGSPATSASW